MQEYEDACVVVHVDDFDKLERGNSELCFTLTLARSLCRNWLAQRSGATLRSNLYRAMTLCYATAALFVPRYVHFAVVDSDGIGSNMMLFKITEVRSKFGLSSFPCFQIEVQAAAELPSMLWAPDTHAAKSLLTALIHDASANILDVATMQGCVRVAASILERVNIVLVFPHRDGLFHLWWLYSHAFILFELTQTACEYELVVH
jgi:hypothetical protein